MSKPSVERLRGFLTEAYLNDPKQGSPTMSAAVRDLLTDLLHLGDVHNISIQARLLDAEEVYQEEIEETS